MVVASGVVFLAGIIAGGILLVSLASMREDRMRLDDRAPGRVARAGRLVTGLKIEDPGQLAPARKPAVPAGAGPRRRRPSEQWPDWGND
jgi:hypothetical protein